MTKHKKYLSRSDDISTCLFLYPIQIGTKTLTTINNKDFIIAVVRNKFKPSYISTKHAGLLIVGFNQHIILDQLLSDITFCFFSFKLDKLNSLIFGYSSSILSNSKVAIFKNTNPNTVWQQIGILSQYTGLELFGLAHKTMYEAIKEILSCTILDWNNEIFKKLFQYHLK
ncbi:hypothetical protein C2G38_2153802 [Gigaspora rosea]|uniref:Uncharacterized protein n=1 Tax=Gigaspora rosea TaxID=44941 RepID=A0A397W6Y4_9GLOM|nr:hypothetical protein C2G38_2153802 [Gigaspora rosea]